MERRKCKRFEVFGMVLSYRIERRFFKRPESDGTEYPVHDLSYGGVRFLADSQLKLGSELTMDIRIPGENESLRFKGKVVWVSSPPGQSYQYEIGVQFNPYGDKKGLNPPENLDRLKAMGRKANPPRTHIAADVDGL